MVMPVPVRLGAQKQAISPGRWNAQSSRAANGRAAWPLDVGQLQTRYGTGGHGLQSPVRLGHAIRCFASGI